MAIEFVESGAQEGQAEAGKGLPGEQTDHASIAGSANGHEPENDLDWFDSLEYDDCFWEVDWNRFAKSLDFGADGISASVTDWHELLQITAADSQCGVVYVRGNFPDNAEAILGRVQSAYQKGTWGLALPTEAEAELDGNLGYTLGSGLTQGLINHRWPYMKYELFYKGCNPGTYEVCSFVKDGTLYQVSRFVPGEPSNPKKVDKTEAQNMTLPTARRSLEVPPANTSRRISMTLPPAKTAKESGKETTKEPPETAAPLRFRVGGAVRFGCVCSNGELGRDQYRVTSFQDQSGLSCFSERYRRCLDMQLFVNRKPIDIGSKRVFDLPDSDVFVKTQDDDDSPWKEKLANICVEHTIDVNYQVPTVVVTTLSLRTDEGGKPVEVPNPEEVTNYLGFNETSRKNTKRLWNSCELPEQDGISAIARCMEVILSVCSIPISRGKAQIEEPSTEKEKEKEKEEEGDTSHDSQQISLATDQLLTTDQPLAIDQLLTTDQPLTTDRPLIAVVQATQPEGGSLGLPVAIGPPQADLSIITTTDKDTTEEPLDAQDVPTIKDTTTEAETLEDERPEQQSSNEISPMNGEPAIALIRNIMGPQYASVESTFWQLRFLAKAHLFLKAQPFATYNEGGWKVYAEIYSKHKERLFDQIRGILIWLLTTNVQTLVAGKQLLPSSIVGNPLERAECTFRPSRVVTKRDSAIQACYFTMSIWFALKYFPEAANPVLKDKTLCQQLVELDSVCKAEEIDRLTKPGLEITLVQWHHFSCLKQICDHLNGTDPELFSQLNLNVDEILRSLKRWQGRVMKSIGPSRRPRIHTYSIKEEIEDRLALLAGELHSESLEDSVEVAKACERYVRQRVESRENTVKVNTGGKDWTDTSQDNKKSKSAPWELTCLNHHTSLKVVSIDGEDHEIDTSRRDCLEFLCSDSTFISSWNESDVDMIQHWWDIDTSAVVCSTLIDLLLQGQHDVEAPEDPTYDVLSPVGGARAQQVTQPVAQTVVDDSLRRLIRMQQDLLEKSKASSTKPYRWQDNKPPMHYHPGSWLKSLDDTPAELFRSTQRKNVDLRTRIKKYFTDFNNKHGKNNPEPPAWDMKNVSRELPATDLLYLSVYEFAMEIELEAWILGRSSNEQIDKEFIHGPENDDGSGRTNIDNTLDKTWSKYFDSHIWSWLLDDRDTLPDPQSLQHLSARATNKLKDIKWRQTFSAEYQRSIFEFVNDSMVDRRIKYRVFFVERCCPTLVNAFMYMWHTAAIDAFNDYFGPVSRFTEIRDDDTWTTSITLNYWGLRLQELPDGIITRFGEVRKEGDFPPHKVGALPDTDDDIEAKASNLKDIVEEQSSCLVITGDRRGRLWVCSVWSALVDERQMVACIEEIPAVLRQFIYSQPVGRCLVFLHLLGHLCEKLSEVYKKFVDGLDSIVNLGQDVFLHGHGLDWKAESAVPKLKKMLWGLEALRVLEDKLGSSIYELKKAADKMEYIISQEPGQLDNELELEYKRIKEDFTKRNELLQDYEGTIQMRIKQITGLRDGISTVTNVEDSKVALEDSATALKQGKNIKVLTWLTILYLPLGFVTALFAAGHGIIPDESDSRLFTGLIIVFLVFTLVIAPFIIGWVDRTIDVLVDWRFGDTPKKKKEKAALRNEEIARVDVKEIIPFTSTDLDPEKGPGTGSKSS